MLSWLHGMKKRPSLPKITDMKNFKKKIGLQNYSWKIKMQSVEINDADKNLGNPSAPA